MKKQITIYTLIAFLLLVGWSLFAIKNKKLDNQPQLIAHAGGGINGLTYMNSLEAIDLNYSLGLRYFEIDFSWTNDDRLVCIHDWKQSYKRLFNNDTKKAPRGKCSN